MGKKNKKSRRYDGDDLLLAPPSDHEHEAQDNNDDDAGDADADAAATASPADAENKPPAKMKESKKTKKKLKQKTVDVNIDLVLLEETMTDILRSYHNSYQSEDWLYRTIEKNMHLPKHSLKQGLESHILDEMLDRVEQDVQQTLDQEYCVEMNKAKRWEDLLAEMCEKSELTDEDEANLRREAHASGLADPDEAVATVKSSIQNKRDKEKEGGEAEAEQDQQLGDASASFAVSILLILQPYIQQPSSQRSTFGKLFWIMRQYTCLLIYTIFCLVLGEQAKHEATRTWEKLHLPSIQAEQLAQEKEEDEYMLQVNTHLWSNEQGGWIERNATYSPPSTDTKTGVPTTPLPATIRYNEKRKQWERWSKNLTTRTKAMKQAAAAGISTSFTKGTFVPVRAGEGWVSAPDQPEVETKHIANYDILFFLCLPTKDGEFLEVIDVTTWATKSLLSRDAARELDAVDSGKEVFSVDVSTLLKKESKKGRNSKNKKIKPQTKDNSNEEEEEDGPNSVSRKGVGCTARISDRYLDRL